MARVSEYAAQTGGSREGAGSCRSGRNRAGNGRSRGASSQAIWRPASWPMTGSWGV